MIVGKGHACGFGIYTHAVVEFVVAVLGNRVDSEMVDAVWFRVSPAVLSHGWHLCRED